MKDSLAKYVLVTLGIVIAMIAIDSVAIFISHGRVMDSLNQGEQIAP